MLPEQAFVSVPDCVAVSSLESLHPAADSSYGSCRSAAVGAPIDAAGQDSECRQAASFLPVALLQARCADCSAPWSGHGCKDARARLELEQGRRLGA
eukprot:360503-Chlamydomonas_euryale.AAC.6